MESIILNFIYSTLELKVTLDFLMSIIIFLSVISGFYITSLTFFTTSNFIKNLYKIEYKNKTLLHKLLNRYRLGLFLSLFLVVYCIFMIFYISSKETHDFILLSNPFSLVLIVLLFWNFFTHYKLINDYIKIILQETKTH